MTTVAGTVHQPVRRLSQGVQDPVTQRAVRAVEDKLVEMEARLTDAERRLKAGGL